jgi:Flp pilus assembly protein TadG
VIRLRAFFRDARGSAAIEFAIASLFLFGIMMVALDFGVYAQQNLRLGNAIEQGAVIAFNHRSAGTIDTTSITNYVSAVAGGSPAVSYQCNGAACSSAISSKCIAAPTAAGGWPSFSSPTTSNNVSLCANGAVPGYYLVIRATKTYHAVVVPNRYLNGATMFQQAVVRLS